MQWISHLPVRQHRIFFLVLLGLTGAFLAKGAQEPFGRIYNLMFANIPGFILFRDPTKFYVLTALSYAVLIPLTIELLSEKFHKYRLKTFLTVIFLGFWIITIRQALWGNFIMPLRSQEIPDNYIALHQKISG